MDLSLIEGLDTDILGLIVKHLSTVNSANFVKACKLLYNDEHLRNLVKAKGNLISSVFSGMIHKKIKKHHAIYQNTFPNLYKHRIFSSVSSDANGI